MQAWHWRVVIKSTYYAKYCHLRDPVVYSGSCKTHEECIKKINELPYPAFRQNIWYDPYFELPDTVIYPKLIGIK